MRSTRLCRRISLDDVVRMECKDASQTRSSAVRKLAPALYRARRTRVPLKASELRVPACAQHGTPDHTLSLAEGYKVQAELVSMLREQAAIAGAPASAVHGYKIGCTSEAAQRKAGVKEPVRGELLAHTCFAAPAEVSVGSLLALRIVEPEFAFQMACDMEPRTDWSAATISKGVKGVMPCIEVATTALADVSTAGTAALVADNCAHASWVYGKACYGDWQALDVAEQEVEVWVNGELASAGRGSLVLGDPLNALAWLANSLGRLNRGLREGDVVSTGACVDPLVQVDEGDCVTAKFGPQLGEVEIQFTA